MPGSDITFAWCFITKQEKKKEKKRKEVSNLLKYVAVVLLSPSQQ